ncbi:MAG: hypothetical protein NVS4B6_01280 [Mycobacterium sp.]
MGAYTAAPGEHVLRLSVTSSLFPHLPHQSRTPFRVALTALFLVLLVLGLLGWQAPLIAVSALGLPMVFALYLHESDVDDDLPASSLVLTAGLGVALGASWALLTGAIIAANYDVALSAGPPEAPSILESLAIPAGAALLMLVPTVVVRLFLPSTTESLDGFVFGALSAIAFTASATLTRLAPQFTTGVTAHDRPVSGLLAEAGIQGVAAPLTTAAAGGLVGVSLWFARSDGKRLRPAVVLLVSSFLVVVVLYGALGALEVATMTSGLHLGLHLLVAAVALLALRVGVQAALLHEAHGETDPETQVLCPHCEHIVPDSQFCPNCGVATRAASRTARATRRITADTARSVTRPGYAVPSGSYTAVPVRRTGHTRLLTTLGLGAAVAAVVAVTVSGLVTPPSAHYVCPPDCGEPPIGKPVATNPWFKSSDGRFAVQYPSAGSAYTVKLEADGVKLDFTAGDTGTMELFGQSAAGRTPKQIAESLISRHYPDATTAYEIPNAMVGYQPAYGVVKDQYPQDASGRFTRLRLLVMVAVKDNYALVAAAMGPYHKFTPDFGSGHPSGVNMELALDMGKYVNSFAWRGDSPQ